MGKGSDGARASSAAKRSAGGSPDREKCPVLVAISWTACPATFTTFPWGSWCSGSVSLWRKLGAGRGPVSAPPVRGSSGEGRGGELYSSSRTKAALAAAPSAWKPSLEARNIHQLASCPGPSSNRRRRWPGGRWPSNRQFDRLQEQGFQDAAVRGR